MAGQTARPAANPAATFSVIGGDVAITGDVAADADLHVDGSVTGDVDCATLVQGAESRIHGAVRADNARLAGRVEGTLKIGDLAILATARIEGDVHYRSLTIEQGAQVDGRFVPDTGETASDGEKGIDRDRQAEPRLTVAK